MIGKALLINQVGKVPFLCSGLRWFARRYPEGSGVKIKNGRPAGFQWKRYHRHVSGYWLGTYELPVQECLARELEPGDIFYDIDANSGFFSLLSSKCVGDKGHVFVFEPLPDNIDTIKSQLKLNQVTNTTLIEAAVSDSEGKIKFCESSHASTARIKRPDDNGTAVTVKTLTIDKFIKTERPPDLIKMDIEGAELKAFKGAKQLSNQNPPKLPIELHGQPTVQKVHEMLKEKDYSFYTPELKKINSAPLPKHVLAIPAKTN